MSRPAGVAAASLLAAMCLAAQAAAEPPPVLTPPTAETTINDLKAQGYDVAINWVAGNTTSALSKCTVVGVHNPNADDAPPSTFTTVYVDVSCPSQQAPLELGIGF